MRRTQAERSSATTAGLTATAVRLFGERGYAATSLDDVAQAAGVTKGAVYHHFGSKAGLFRAVLVSEEEHLAQRLIAAAAAATEPWAAVRAGCEAFLRACLDPAFRQIVLLDAPAVFGLAEVRAIEDDHVIALLRHGLRRASGHRDIDARLRLLIGALCEAGALLARDPDALDALNREVALIIDAYRAG
jgi:AcrR family transcriptional regulator